MFLFFTLAGKKFMKNKSSFFIVILTIILFLEIISSISFAQPITFILIYVMIPIIILV